MEDTKKDPFSEMAAALNGHEITDPDGQVREDDTSLEETAAPETNTEEDAATVEKPAESEESAPKADDEETEPQLAEDESGKRYVPEARFKKVYGELKATQRELDSFKKGKDQALKPTEPMIPQSTLDKPSQLETELLYATSPQFNPYSDQYDSELDDLAVNIYLANPGITKLEAARRAVIKAKNLTKDQAKIISEARSVKAQQSDQGITSRVTNRAASNEAPGEGASLEEMEAYLRKTGDWNSKRL